MAATTWKAGSGDWNDPSSWTNGVPTAADVAVFPTDGLPFAIDANNNSVVTVTGSGPALAIDVLSSTNSPADTLRFTGTHSVRAASIVGGAVDLASTASLSFSAATLTGLSSGGLASLQLDAGATLGTATVRLADAVLRGLFGALSNPLQLSGQVEINGSGVLAGAISGTGSLTVGDKLGSAQGTVTVTGNASGYSGPVDVQAAGLALAAGESGLDTLTTDGTTSAATISAVSQDVLVFNRVGLLKLFNGSGHATVVGAIGPTYLPPIEAPPSFGELSVNGGTGSLTVFGNDDSGQIIGGSAGSNVIVAGASATGYVGNPGSGPYSGPLGAVLAPAGATIVGGGNGDLLVAAGRFGNLVAAAGGNETLNGSGATGSDTFFGGTGADEIAAGQGQNTVVAGSGAETIFGSSGSTDIFAGAGNELIVGGSGADYIQEGRGTAAVYAGSGTDQIGVINGQSGGTMTVTGFKAGTDRINVQGYSSGPAVTVAGGNTTLTFSDNTQLTLIGVTQFSASSII